MVTTIRHAQPDDVPQLVSLINDFAARDLMLPRSPETIHQALPDWLVASTVGEEGQVVGCGALVALTEDLAEIRSLAVHGSQHGRGVGSEIVHNLLALARAREFQQVCALTLQEGFFQRLGFEVVDRWRISPKLWQECIYCPKFHRCDEVAVLANLTRRSLETMADVTQPAAWNSLLRWQSWQPLRLAYSHKPIRPEKPKESE